MTKKGKRAQLPKGAKRVVEKFLSYLQNTRKLSPNTVDAYRGDLRRFAAYCAVHGALPEAADRSIIRGFLSELSREGLMASSINRATSSLKGYFRFLVRMNHRAASPMIGLHSMKTPKPLPTFLSETEVNELMRKPDDRFTGIRDRLVLELLYSTGCRVSELAGMNMSDLSLSDRRAKVRGKGNRERMVFLGEEAVDAIRTWIPMRENRLDRDDTDAERALVLNSHGRRISARGIFYLISRYVDEALLGRKVGPHTFRHSFATHVLNRGADLRVVQELLGHANLSTTQVYTHTGIERLAAVYAKAHPHGAARKSSTSSSPRTRAGGRGER